MNRKLKKIVTGITAGAVMIASAMAFMPGTALAESEDIYVALGADLSSEQRAEVLSLLGVSEEDLEGDTVIYVDNEEEHRFLDGTVPQEKIGTKSLSSCKIIQRENGHGIQVETHNITYVTPAMYENALATAGMKNADVIVAGPTSISGTAALVGAMEAYARLNGQVIQPDAIKAAVQELETSAALTEALGDSDKITQLIASVKQIIAENDLSDEDDLRKAITDVAAQLGYTLSDSEMSQAITLMKTIAALDLDPQVLTEQARAIYGQAESFGLDLSEYGITEEDMNSILDGSAGIIEKGLNFLKNIF